MTIYQSYFGSSFMTLRSGLTSYQDAVLRLLWYFFLSDIPPVSSVRHSSEIGRGFLIIGINKQHIPPSYAEPYRQVGKHDFGLL